MILHSNSKTGLRTLFGCTCLIVKSGPNVKKPYDKDCIEIKRKNVFKDYTFYRKRIKGIKID